MAWESVETNETEKGSYFPSMGSAPGRAALPLFFPMGWECLIQATGETGLL